jgi:hypothetical protein
MKLGTKMLITALMLIFTFTAFAAGNTKGSRARETNQNALNLEEENAANPEEEALLKEEIPTQKNEGTTDEATEEAKNSEALSDEEIALANSYPEGLESADVNF